MEYVVLYTHQKTKKAKTWQDGVLSVRSNRAVLYDDNKTKLDAMYVKPEAIVLGEQLESDRYFILIEEKKTDKPTISEPVQRVSCSVRVPIRTGLKRKKSGFIPPRVVNQPLKEESQIISTEASSTREPYIDLLRKKKRIQLGNLKSPQRENVRQMYNTNNTDYLDPNSSGLQDKLSKRLYSSDEAKISLNKQSNHAEQSSPVNNSHSANLAKETPQNSNFRPLSSPCMLPGSQNQSSPWSSYSNKLKTLNNHAKSTKSSPLISQIYDTTSSQNSDGSSMSEKSSGQNNEALEAGLESMRSVPVTIDVKLTGSSNEERKHSTINSKRSMSQIMTLLAKDTSKKESQTIAVKQETKTSDKHVCADAVEEITEKLVDYSHGLHGHDTSSISESCLQGNTYSPEVENVSTPFRTINRIKPVDVREHSGEHVNGYNIIPECNASSIDILTNGDCDVDDIEDFTVSFNINFSPLSHVSDTDSVTMEINDASSTYKPTDSNNSQNRESQPCTNSAFSCIKINSESQQNGAKFSTDVEINDHVSENQFFSENCGLVQGNVSQRITDNNNGCRIPNEGICNTPCSLDIERCGSSETVGDLQFHNKYPNELSPFLQNDTGYGLGYYHKSDSAGRVQQNKLLSIEDLVSVTEHDKTPHLNINKSVVVTNTCTSISKRCYQEHENSTDKEIEQLPLINNECGEQGSCSDKLSQPNRAEGSEELLDNKNQSCNKENIDFDCQNMTDRENLVNADCQNSHQNEEQTLDVLGSIDLKKDTVQFEDKNINNIVSSAVQKNIQQQTDDSHQGFQSLNDLKFSPDSFGIDSRSQNSICAVDVNFSDYKIHNSINTNVYDMDGKPADQDGLLSVNKSEFIEKEHMALLTIGNYDKAETCDDVVSAEYNNTEDHFLKNSSDNKDLMEMNITWMHEQDYSEAVNGDLCVMEDRKKKYFVTDNLTPSSDKEDNAIHRDFRDNSKKPQDRNSERIERVQIFKSHSYCETKALPTFSRSIQNLACSTEQRHNDLHRDTSSQYFSLTQGLQHPNHLFSKKSNSQLKKIQVMDFETSKIPQLSQDDQQKDIKNMASEILQGYIMKGSVISGAARRTHDVSELDRIMEDESFYIDLSTNKPQIQTRPNLTAKYFSSPGHFVPNTPDFHTVLKKKESSQGSETTDIKTEEDVFDESSPSVYSVQGSFKKCTFRCENDVHVIRKNENGDRINEVCQGQGTKVKTPFISAPEGDFNVETNTAYYVDTGKLESSKDPFELTKDKILVEVSDRLSSESSEKGDSPKLTYWEKKLLQRQKCRNIFINNEVENSQQSTRNNNNCTKRKGLLNESAFFTRDDQINGDNSSFGIVCLNTDLLQFCTNDSVDCSDEKCHDINQMTESKWGKYADFEDEDDDDILTFDQSFTLKSETIYNNKLSLRPPTEHHETLSADYSDKYHDGVLDRPTGKDYSDSCFKQFDVQSNKKWFFDLVQNTDCINKSNRKSLHSLNNAQSSRIKFTTDTLQTKQYMGSLTSDHDSYPCDSSDNSPDLGVDITPALDESTNVECDKKLKYPTQSEKHTIDNSGSDMSGRNNTGLGRKFRCPLPQLSTSTFKGSKRSLGSKLQFPSGQEVTDNSTPTRQIEIPTRFVSLSHYKQIFTAVLREHLNIILFDLSSKFHHALSKIDTSSYLSNNAGKENKGPVYSNPACKCGAPSKMIQVKKPGPNKNRFFYTCNAARNTQCKFFQWVDDKRGGCNRSSGANKLTLSDPSSITTFVRSHHIFFYCDCVFLKKSAENIMNHFKRNVPSWVKRKMGMGVSNKKKLYIQLSKRDSSTIFSKDDLWIISRYLDFRSSSTILCKSTYYGPTSGNEVEIEPISSFCPSNWPNEERCHAILAGNVSGELSYLENLEENVNLTSVPVLHTLFSSTESIPPSIANVGQQTIYIPEKYVYDKVEELIKLYKLNEDQSTALTQVARMFTQINNDVLLIHGVFGAGKSFLLSVVILFLVWLFEKNDSYTPGVPYQWKVMIASTTNVAVDRILNGLLSLSYEDFVRVGSVKKISKPVLPFSLHATGSDSQELKDLQLMLRSDELTSTEKQNVRQSIEKQKLGENRKRLNKVRVVGVTCASSSAPCLKDMVFPIVLLDECSQMTEPASLLPIAKFKCRKLVLVGDPKQLDPTIQGSESSTDHGLEQTLFDRLTLMGHRPVMLHTQYRCHPDISNISNSLFYGNQLHDGITQTDRFPILEELPALCFYDVANATEKVDSDGSFYNEREADFIMSLIKVLVYHEVEAERIGVISLYKSQMHKIINLIGSNKNCKEMKGVLVSTVDAFQGGEKDVIILSCVRTKYVGFIDNHKRINVALTRARHHLLIVGNRNILIKNRLWGQIIQICQETSSNGIQNAEEAREKFKVEIESEESQQGAQRKRKSSQESSPPMSLSGSVSSLPAVLSLDEVCSIGHDVTGRNESSAHQVPTGREESTKPKQRRKRRKIDASLIDKDACFNVESDDEELPSIF